jgi:hypothetical protein
MTAVSVARESLLQLLESVEPGTAQKEMVEQSSCFAFANEKVRSYNDDTAVEAKSPLGDFVGAVQAKPLMELLRRLPDEHIEVEPNGIEFRVTSKNGRRRAGIRMEHEVTLPRIRKDDRPKKWHSLPEEFNEAISVVQACASTDQTKFSTTCIHLTPKHIEACNDYQLCRWKMKLALTGATLVRQSSLRHVTKIHPTEFSETEHWLHFRGAGQDLVMSCRRYADEDEGPDAYPDVGSHIGTEGAIPLELPKNIVDPLEIAKEFASDTDLAIPLIEMNIQPGKLTLSGKGALAWYSETRKFKGYRGEPMRFMIGPTLLAELVKNHNSCLILPQRLVVKGNNMVYAVSLVSKDEGTEEIETDDSAEPELEEAVYHGDE